MAPSPSGPTGPNPTTTESEPPESRFPSTHPSCPCVSTSGRTRRSRAAERIASTRVESSGGSQGAVATRIPPATTVCAASHAAPTAAIPRYGMNSHDAAMTSTATVAGTPNSTPIRCRTRAAFTVEAVTTLGTAESANSTSVRLPSRAYWTPKTESTRYEATASTTATGVTRVKARRIMARRAASTAEGSAAELCATMDCPMLDDTV